MINDGITHINFGTAKSYEHLGTKFAFRAEGDGAFEQQIMDKFSLEAPVLESLDDRKFRAFLKKEQVMNAPESAGRTAEQGKQQLQELIETTLGDGWKVEDFNAPRGGTPNLTTLELRDGASKQEITIDRYSRQPEIKLTSGTNIDGWKVSQVLSASLNDGAVDSTNSQEQVFFIRH
jgi:hypothetical protein